MHDVLTFHRCHGSSVVLADGASVASRRHGDFCNAAAFSAQPIKAGQKVCVELTQSREWSGALRIGVTTHDPAKIPPLPRYVCPELTRREGFWARGLDERYADHGNRVTLYVNAKGQLHYFVNKAHKGVFLGQLPVNQRPLWLLFDIYGSTTAAKFVLPDEAPVEILARGPEALRAFHTACESGTQAVFRTRLMLVGQARVGKTSLKKTLTGQSLDESEVSTEGIDLSASCSFNLRDRSAWKLAMSNSGPAGTEDKPDVNSAPLSVMGGVESLEEEYHRALATNIVQELLYLRKRERDEAESAATTPANSASSRKPPSHCDIHHKPGSGARRITREKVAPRLASASSTSSTLTSAGLRDHQLLQEVPDRVVTMVTDMMRRRDDEGTDRKTASDTGAHSGKNITLNIWDFAGQAVYYTTHQVFLSSRAVYLMVFDLSKPLTPDPTPDLTPDLTPDMTPELTSLDYLDYWMNCIHAHAAQNKRDAVDNTMLSPPIFIVGTHRGSLSTDSVQQEKLVEQKFDVLRQHISGKPYERHVYQRYYAVENSVSDGEDSQVLSLRRAVEELSSQEPYMGEQIPIKWLQFEQILTQLTETGTFFSSVEQIREVARECGIVLGAEFSTLLGFYHDLGVIIHYGGPGTLDEVLRNTVILRPQWLIDMFKTVTTSQDVDPKWRTVKELWQRLLARGVLEERLLDMMWEAALPQKPALLRLMEKFDLIAERLSPKQMTGKSSERLGPRKFYVPCRLQPAADTPQIFSPSTNDVVFYFDFNGFLPDGLFHRLLTRALRWSQECGGHDPKMFYRQARLFIDSEHDVILQMAPLKLARIKVTVIRLVDLDDSEESSGEGDDKPLPPARPTACAKVRNFLESTLSDLREMWMKRISHKACVQCTCDRECTVHSRPRCTQEQCVHFLHLDECISNKIVCCDHRRVKTAPYRKWFPVPAQMVSQGPVLSNSLIEDFLHPPSPRADKDADLALPPWVRSAAKLLNGGPEGQDWMALAKRLEYKRNKIDKFTDDLNPGLSLITDWIISSGNTSLSMDILITYLEQMQRDDIVDVIQKGQESEQEPPQVFISYQWDSQDEVTALRDRLEKAGYSCWMDIGQMGGGDQLYSRIDEGIRNCKVVVACLTPKYTLSHLCNKEMSLADLLRKPILPVMYEKVSWPPPGGMALAFSQLVYINMKGVGGHGGSGIHADVESKYQEIIQRVSAHGQAKPHPTLPLSSPPGPEYTSDPSIRSEAYTSDREMDIHDRPTYNTISSGGITTQNLPSMTRSDISNMVYHQNTVEQVHVTKCAVCVIL